MGLCPLSCVSQIPILPNALLDKDGVLRPVLLSMKLMGNMAVPASSLIVGARLYNSQREVRAQTQILPFMPGVLKGGGCCLVCRRTPFLTRRMPIRFFSSTAMTMTMGRKAAGRLLISRTKIALDRGLFQVPSLSHVLLCSRFWEECYIEALAYLRLLVSRSCGYSCLWCGMRRRRIMSLFLSALLQLGFLVSVLSSKRMSRQHYFGNTLQPPSSSPSTPHFLFGK